MILYSNLIQVLSEEDVQYSICADTFLRSPKGELDAVQYSLVIPKVIQLKFLFNYLFFC